MRTSSLGAVLVIGAAALAAPKPALARSSQIDCPAMPTPNDTEAESSGGFGLTFAGFGANLDRSRSRSTKDVMMREGGFDAWSAALLLSHSCQINRKLYPNDLARQRDELAALRDRLVRHQPAAAAPVPSYPPQPYVLPRSRTPVPAYLNRIGGVDVADAWKALPTSRFVPQAALAAGVLSGSAAIDCAVSREAALHDCRVRTESPIGLGFGEAVLRFATSLRLKDSVRTASWTPGRVKLRIMLTS